MESKGSGIVQEREELGHKGEGDQKKGVGDVFSSKPRVELIVKESLGLILSIETIYDS